MASVEPLYPGAPEDTTLVCVHNTYSSHLSYFEVTDGPGVLRVEAGPREACSYLSDKPPVILSPLCESFQGSNGER